MPDPALSPLPPEERTLGQLRASGYEVVPVKEEIRRNVLARLASGDPIFAGIYGYDDTVVPQVENALLAEHDIVFLGERGQAKSRIIRQVVDLLDEWIPVLDGSEINDNPYGPVSKFGRELVAEMRDEAPVAWVHRNDRLAEKLATPDASVADLIGEVDPIKVAEGRYLSDELTIHYGLVPRANRGIFVINELPDLAERIQVALLNVLEERDVQVRGYMVRLPLDVILLASANPEDYTSRGRIITPLKDRFGSQIRTHYPVNSEVELAIVDQESRPFDTAGRRIEVPEFMRQIIAEISQRARESSHVNHASGVSVRLTISNYEVLIANSLRRAVVNGEDEVVPRISDLGALSASTVGKIEIDSFTEGHEDRIVEQIVKESILVVFRAAARQDQFRSLIARFDEGFEVRVGDAESARSIVEAVGADAELQTALASLGAGDSPGSLASAIEFVLEGLHLSKRLNKTPGDETVTYSAR